LAKGEGGASKRGKRKIEENLEKKNYDQISARIARMSFPHLNEYGKKPGNHLRRKTQCV
jgi:hypothetical protein